MNTLISVCFFLFLKCDFFSCLRHCGFVMKGKSQMSPKMSEGTICDFPSLPIRDELQSDKMTTLSTENGNSLPTSLSGAYEEYLEMLWNCMFERFVRVLARVCIFVCLCLSVHMCVCVCVCVRVCACVCSSPGSPFLLFLYLLFFHVHAL